MQLSGGAFCLNFGRVSLVCLWTLSVTGMCNSWKHLRGKVNGKKVIEGRMVKDQTDSG